MTIYYKKKAGHNIIESSNTTTETLIQVLLTQPKQYTLCFVEHI